MKRLFAVLVVLGIVLSLLAGCGGATEQKDTTQATTQATTQQTTQTVESTVEATTVSFDKPVKFSYMTIAGIPKIEENELYQFVSKKFNIEFEQIGIFIEQWEEKVKTAVESGNLPDIMWMQYLKLGDLKKYKEAGLIRDVPEFGAKYPNLQKLRDEMTASGSLKSFEIDGKLYAWTKRLYSSPYGSADSQSYLYRKDWAEIVGMADIAAKGALTIDEFYALMKAFVDQDPQKNGAGKTFALGGEAWAFPSYAGPLLFSPQYNSFKKLEDGTYVWGAALPETLEGIKFAKKLYSEGLLAKDFDRNTWGLFNGGKIGIYNNNFVMAGLNGATYMGFTTPGKTTKSYDVVGIFSVIGPEGKVNVYDVGDYYGLDLYSSKLDDERFERILYMMDWIASDEGKNTCFYGMKGTDWDYVDGKAVCMWPKDANGVYVQPSSSLGGEVIRMWALNGGDWDFVNPNLYIGAKNEYDKVAKIKSEIGNFIDYNYELVTLNTPTWAVHGSFYTDIEKEITRIIKSSNDVEGDWNAFLKSKEADMKIILDEINTAVKNKQ